MSIYNIFIINRAGSLIYDYDSSRSTTGSSMTINPGASQTVSQPVTYNNPEYDITYQEPPVDLKLDMIDGRLTVAFGERDGVKVGFVLSKINGEVIGGKIDQNIFADTAFFPLTFTFIKPPLNTNEKIILSSMFHSLHAIAAQLSPVPRSSGIENLDTDLYRLQCYQTLTGLKLVVVADHACTPYLDQLLKKVYELYADYALKNPFYSLEMPIRCDLFDQCLKLLLEKTEKSGGIICV